jgi:DNA repair protein RecO (recombination protein O)
MIIKTRAIVLHSFKFGENKFIVDLFTEEQGRVSFIAPISSSTKAKIKKQYFQPFSIIEIEYDYRQKKTLQQFKDVGVVYPYVSIPFDSYKLAISLFLAEFTSYAIRDEQKNVPLFEYVVNSLQWLDGCNVGFSNFHLVYMIHLLKFIGFYPNLDDYEKGFYFDMRSGCYTSLVPFHREYLSVGDTSLLATFCRMDYSNMHIFKMSHVDRNRLVDVVLSYYRLHVPKFTELKSYDVLKELYK